MKGYYIHFGAREGSVGVSRKIDMQIREFSKYFEMEEIEVRDTPVRKMDTLMVLAFMWASQKRGYDDALERISDPAFIYVRRTTADRKYIAFLSEIKKRYPKCKIIVELFTYPYDRDSYDTFLTKPLLWKERHYRRKYRQCIDRFVTYSEDREIFGVKTIRTMNGIDVSDIAVVSPAKKEEKSSIHVIFVAYMQKQHGFERFLFGLRDYYAQNHEREIVCHCVGDGPELPGYKKMAEEFALEDKIIFYGKKSGKELDEIYNKADLAVSSLGLYKLGIQTISALKVSEYLAKGLPVVTGCNITIFEKHSCSFHVDFPNDSTPLDFSRVVDYYEELQKNYSDRGQLIMEIRKYAEQYADNSVVLQPIIDYVRSAYIQTGK